MNHWSPAADALAAVKVHESAALPLRPTDGEVARRIVRHGMADVLAWLGEDVGPRPTDHTHALLIDGDLHVSHDFLRNLRAYAGRPTRVS